MTSDHLLLPQTLLLPVILLVIQLTESISTNMEEVKDNISTDNTNTSDKMLIEVYTTWIDFAKHFVPTALFVDRYVTIIYYILGFPGNFLSLIIWSNRRMIRENSAAVYLAALSLNDIIVLIFALNRDLSRVWQIHEYLTPGSCEIQNILSPAVQYASPLFVLAFTIERWLAICKPFYIDRICSPRRAIYICFTIIISVILVCSGQAYIFITEINTCSKRHINPLIISIYLSCLEAVFAGVVPLLVLIFNCLVIKELDRVHQANKQLTIMSNYLSSTSSSSLQPLSQLNSKNTLKHQSKHLSNHEQHKKKINCYFKNIFSNQITSSQSRISQKQTNEILINKNLSIETTPYDVQNSMDIIKSSPIETTFNVNNQHNSIDEYNKTPINGQSSIYNRISTELPGVNVNQTRKDSHSKRSSPSFRSTTLMLLTVSFYTILTTLLGGLVYLIHQTQEEPNMNATEKEALEDPVWNRYFKMITIKAFGDEIALSHYAFGFIIYYVTGCNFRQRVHQLLRRLFYKLGCRCRNLMKLGINEDSESIPSIARRSQNRLLTNSDRRDDADFTLRTSHRQSQKRPVEIIQSYESMKPDLLKLSKGCQ
ncbi:Pyrokinin-1 receptor [Schistosoma japonicum]|uniref:Pyrokinin-1 receptor n=1 Tax=Schistosoma japonicum TaxID=6182 RepID=A0A4Z2CR34_SCHJA|nr:Pyrokinin-1 receptor [Schistosoma japonicum]